jgi:ribA/ribD-fused uncharacterized protein
MSDAPYENEGEEEEGLAAPTVEADKDLGALNFVPLLPQTGPGEENVEEEKAEKAEKAETVKPKPITKQEEVSKEEESLERAAYLKKIRTFYAERARFFSGYYSKGSGPRAASIRSIKQGKHDSKIAQITPEGILILLTKEGTVKFEIPPLSYREPEAADHEEIEAKRKALVEEAQLAFEEARQTLRELTKRKSSHEDIKEAMRLVTEADQALQEARFVTKGVKLYNTTVANLLFNKYAKGSLIVKAFEGEPMTLQERYAILDTEGEMPKESAKPSPDVILVSYPEGDHDFMSLWYMKSFEYEKVKYICAYQAVMAGLARKFENEEEVSRILAERDPKQMVLRWDTFETKEDEPITEEKWNKRLERILLKVHRAKFSNSKLAKKLADTGSMRIGYIDPDQPTETFQGIGIPFDDVEQRAYQRYKWKGENIVGQVLEKVRMEVLAALAPAEKPKKAKAEKKPAAEETQPPPPEPKEPEPKEPEPKAPEPKESKPRSLRRKKPLDEGVAL